MNKALFLDRDGVINKEINYLHKIEDFEFNQGILDLCKTFQDRGYLIIVVTNQAGIARGYYTENDFVVLTEWMIQEFKNKGIIISGVYHCPHHPEYTGECECRKPNPGMLLTASKDFNLDLKNSVLIGDKVSDINAAKRAGIGKSYLIETNTLVKIEI